MSEIDAASEQYRHECEAREVMRWPAEKRRWYYAQVEKHRGLEAARRLCDEVKRQYELRNK